MTPPWEKYQVPAKGENRKALEIISHVAHVSTAVRILEDHKIRAGIIFDASQLSETSTRVVWLSPNHWHRGFRYGNIRFHFEAAELLGQTRVYWVESMVEYSPHACRFLFTEHEREDLTPYNPSVDKGPWQKIPDGREYWNGNITLEFMVERDLVLNAVHKLDFVMHHPEFCNVDPASCKYKGAGAASAGAEFMAVALGRGLSLKFSGLVKKDGDPSDALKGAARSLFLNCTKGLSWGSGSITVASPEAYPLARAVLASVGNHSLTEDRIRIGELFASSEDLQATVAKIIAAGVGLGDSTKLLPKPSRPNQ